MTDLKGLAIVALAAFYLLSCWQYGSIFATLRASLQARQGALVPDFLTCSLCMAWLAVAAMELLRSASEDYLIARVVLCVLAGAGAVHLAWGLAGQRRD